MKKKEFYEFKAKRFPRIQRFAICYKTLKTLSNLLPKPNINPMALTQRGFYFREFRPRIMAKA